MSDDWAVVVGGVALIAGMSVLILVRQRRKEARLAALTEIEIPIQSTGRAALIIAASMVPGTVLGALLASLTDQYPRHAVAAVLGAVGLGLLSIVFGGLPLAQRYARIGLLRWAPPRLELQVGGQQTHVDLDQPCQLGETTALHPTGIRMQVVALRQGDRLLAFSYGLPMGRKPHGDTAVNRHIEPVVDAEARVIHDRIRQHFPAP
jgi:hypothetical protein